MGNLSKPLLILNSNWTPIRIKDIKTGFKLVFRERAELVDPTDYATYSWEDWILLPVIDDEKYIMTTRGKIRLPEIIILTHYGKIPYFDMRLTKKNLFIRDNWNCQYSGKILSRDEADIDHVIPKSRGGKTTWTNLVVSSKKINRKKGNKTPEEAGLKLLKKPIKPKIKPLNLHPKEEMPESWKKFLR